MPACVLACMSGSVEGVGCSVCSQCAQLRGHLQALLTCQVEDGRMDGWMDTKELQTLAAHRELHFTKNGSPCIHAVLVPTNSSLGIAHLHSCRARLRAVCRGASRLMWVFRASCELTCTWGWCKLRPCAVHALHCCGVCVFVL
eukprot:scaffold104814_cov25-Tisochrysis_lutea.AAC.1